MLSEERIEEIEKNINEITHLFYNENNIKPINIIIEITEDLYKRELELAVSEKQIRDIIGGEKFIRGSNGTMMFINNCITDTAHIIISENAIENNINRDQYLSTYIHELTHAYDFYKFGMFNKLNNLEDIWELTDNRAFHFWTEYNAKRQAYYLYRKILNWDNVSSNAIAKIKNNEIILQINNIKADLFSYQNSINDIIYFIIQFLGRFSVWNDLFPNHFNVNTLPNELINVFGSGLTNLYEFLYDNKRFDDIKLKFSQLDNLLSKVVK